MPTRLSGGSARTLRDTTFTPSRLVPFAAQSREEPVPYSCPAITISGYRAADVRFRRIVDGQLRALRLQQRVSALLAAEHQVLDPHIGEGAAGHDAIIAAAGPVRVEVLERHAVLQQEAAGRASSS
jgi:hypothetical protein